MVGNHRLEKDQCAFYKDKGHWKSDCPKLNKSKKESRLEANVLKSDGNDSDFSYYSLSITPSCCHSDASE